MAVDAEVTRRRFSVDEYHRMGEAGILNEDDRVEVSRDPEAGRFRRVSRAVGATLTPLAFPDVAVSVAAILR